MSDEEKSNRTHICGLVQCLSGISSLGFSARYARQYGILSTIQPAFKALGRFYSFEQTAQDIAWLPSLTQHYYR